MISQRSSFLPGPSWGATILTLLLASGCGGDGGRSTDISETAQQIGDVMASIDESGGSSGNLALLESSHRVYGRLAPDELHDSWLESALMPSAHAASCSHPSTFSSCSNNVITRTLNGCTIGSASFTGNVTLTWVDGAVDNTCQMTAIGHSVTRVPNFTVTGRRGATLTVSKSGTQGQVITRTAPGFDFTNDGIRRVLALPGGSTLFDFTTRTTSAIAVTGALRSNRILNGGTLRVTNNLSGMTCDYSPSNVAWSFGCNCPTSGSWSGSCSDGKTTRLQITGCGSGTFTVGEESESFSFDRCYGV